MSETDETVTFLLGPWCKWDDKSIARVWSNGQIGQHMTLSPTGTRTKAWAAHGSKYMGSLVIAWHPDLTRAGLFRKVQEGAFGGLVASGRSKPGSSNFWMADNDQSDHAKMLQDHLKTSMLSSLPARSDKPPTATHDGKPVNPAENSTKQGNTMSDPTVTMVVDNLVFGAKVTSAHQGMRILRKMAYKVAKKKLGTGADAFLKTREGQIMIDLTMPSVAHALASRNLIPVGEGGNEKIAALCDYAFKGSVIRHGLEVSDMLVDVIDELADDLSELVHVATLFIAADAPDLEAEAEALKAKEKVTVLGGEG